MCGVVRTADADRRPPIPPRGPGAGDPVHVLDHILLQLWSPASSCRRAGRGHRSADRGWDHVDPGLVHPDGSVGCLPLPLGQHGVERPGRAASGCGREIREDTKRFGRARRQTIRPHSPGTRMKSVYGNGGSGRTTHVMRIRRGTRAAPAAPSRPARGLRARHRSSAASSIRSVWTHRRRTSSARCGRRALTSVIRGHHWSPSRPTTSEAWPARSRAWRRSQPMERTHEPHSF